MVYQDSIVRWLIDLALKTSMIIFFYLLISAVLGPFRS